MGTRRRNAARKGWQARWLTKVFVSTRAIGCRVRTASDGEFPDDILTSSLTHLRMPKLRADGIGPLAELLA